jgi:ankyrin repeat protein
MQSGQCFAEVNQVSAGLSKDIGFRIIAPVRRLGLRDTDAGGSALAAGFAYSGREIMMKHLLLVIVASVCTCDCAQAQEGEPSRLACENFRLDAERRLEQAPDTLQINMLLFSAAQKGCTGSINKLVQAGASLAARNRDGDTPVAVAAKAGRKSFVADLLQRGAKVEDKDVNGATPLLLAERAGRRDVALQLLDAGADANAADLHGETPLIVAAFNGDAILIEQLLARKADPAVADSTGKTAIVYAAARGAERGVQLLLDSGVGVNQTYDADLTALMWAAGHADNASDSESLQTVRLLLERGAKVDERDDRGRTPLMIAAALNHIGIARTLIAAGADKSLRDHGGKSAADLAATEEMRAAVTAP